MLPESKQERRTEPRTLIHVDVLLSCKSQSCERQKVRVHDLSLSGMSIYRGPLALHVGDTLHICLTSSDKQCSSDHVIDATVVRHQGDMVGIRFDRVGIYVLKDIQGMLRDSRYL